MGGWAYVLWGWRCGGAAPLGCCRHRCTGPRADGHACPGSREYRAGGQQTTQSRTLAAEWLVSRSGAWVTTVFYSGAFFPGGAWGVDEVVDGPFHRQKPCNFLFFQVLRSMRWQCATPCFLTLAHDPFCQQPRECGSGTQFLPTHLWPVPFGTQGVRRGCLRTHRLLYHPAPLPFAAPTEVLRLCRWSRLHGVWSCGSRCPACLAGSRAQFDLAPRLSSPGDLPSSTAFPRWAWQGHPGGWIPPGHPLCPLGTSLLSWLDFRGAPLSCWTQSSWNSCLLRHFHQKGRGPPSIFGK